MDKYDIKQHMANIIKRYIIDDLVNYKIFSEADLQAIIYYHLRYFLKEDSQWLVRCEPTLTNWLKPDIYVTYRNQAVFITELVFHIRDHQIEFPYNRLYDNHKKLKRIKKLKAYANLKDLCLFAVYDAKAEKEQRMLKYLPCKESYYSQVFINVHHFNKYHTWKPNWARIHTR